MNVIGRLFFDFELLNTDIGFASSGIDLLFLALGGYV